MGQVWLAERSDGRFERKAAVKFLNVALMGLDLGYSRLASLLLAQAKKAFASHRELGQQYTLPLRELEQRLTLAPQL
ncbi:MAG: hypothetical protein WAM13_13895 [Candidatus Sulfotelmatobacter sp.]